ncbi:MAG: radical SAM protein [Crenarchaeota archaeon]|nr:radical SAM protein [Thermoproteota archaeon]
MPFKVDEWIIELDRTSKPNSIVVEPSTICNFSCSYCFRNTFYEKTRDFLDIDTFTRLANYCKGIVERIVFTGFGEPTLNPYFHEMLELSFNIFNKVVLNTNGSRILELSNILLRNLDKLELVVSIHDEETLKTVGELMDMVKRRGERIHTRAIVVVTRSNCDDLFNLVERCLDFFSIIVITNIVPIDERSVEDSCIDDPYCENKVKNILARQGFRFMFSGTCVKSVDFKLRTSMFECPFVESKAMFIRSDGRAAPCMFMSHGWRMYLQKIERTIVPVTYGDVSDRDIVDIWRDPEYSKFRFLVKMRQFPCCLDCELVQYCTFTLSNEHDCWGNSPSCAFCPFARKLAFCPV